MTLTLVTLTADPVTLVGADPTSAVRFTVRTNTGGAIIDADGNKLYLGTYSANVKGADTFSVTLPPTNGATNPTAFQYAVDVEYIDAATKKRATWTSGWFSLTATADLADVAAEQYVPPTWMTAAVATLQGYVDEAQGSADDAAASAAAAHDISSITVDDDVVEALVKGTAGAGPKTRAALNSSIDERARSEWMETYYSGTGDATSAYQAAIAALPAHGGVIRSRGDYTVGTTVPIEFPAEPKVVHLIHEGKLLQGAANAPMIRKAVGVSRVFGAKMLGFTVVAHASSTKTTPTNIAVDLLGFDGAKIDIRAEGNATYTSTSGRFHSVVSGHAAGPYCYNNRIRVIMAQTAGPAKIVHLHNGGGGVLSNANLNRVSALAYNLDACDVAVDAADTTPTIVHDSLFESCAGMTAIKAGNFTTTIDNWFENVGTTIDYGVTADTTANNCVSRRDQFSGSHTVKIHSSVAARPEFQHSLFGAMTFQNESGVATTDYQAPRAYTAPAWTSPFSFALGGGTVTADAGPTVRHKIDHHGRITYQMRYFVTPAATGRAVLNLAPPTGFEVESAHISATVTGTAAPIVAGLSNALDGSSWELWWPSTSLHTLNIRVTLKATS